MNHKRGRCKNRRAGCILCKPWKMNGRRKKDKLPYNDYKKDVFTQQDIKDTIMKCDPTDV